MLTLLTDNLGTVLIALILAAIVIGIIINLLKDKKKGRSSCGCGCEHCAMKGTCHQPK